MSVLDELAAGAVALPLPGAGGTAERWLWLMNLARGGDISVARLAEAHLDAVAILAEAGRAPQSGSLYGVWASESGTEPRSVDGSLVGTKRFCSGLGIVDRALVTVWSASGQSLLLDVGVGAVTDVGSTWRSPALRDTATGDAPLDGIADFEEVGTAAWYLDRPGFWHGACGPASCWAGGAIGLVDTAVDLLDDDPHRAAQVGALVSGRWALTAMLQRAGDEIDAEPADRDLAELRARALRHCVERTSSEIADRFSRAFGPRPFVTDEAIAQRFADLHLYMRQHHAERELGAVAELAARAAGAGRDRISGG